MRAKGSLRRVVAAEEEETRDAPTEPQAPASVH